MPSTTSPPTRSQSWRERNETDLSIRARTATGCFQVRYGRCRRRGCMILMSIACGFIRIGWKWCIRGWSQRGIYCAWTAWFFISIDDNEVSNLRKVCSEIFRAENFEANVIWEKKYTRSNNVMLFLDNRDRVLVYTKTKRSLNWASCKSNKTSAFMSFITALSGIIVCQQN